MSIYDYYKNVGGPKPGVAWDSKDAVLQLRAFVNTFDRNAPTPYEALKLAVEFVRMSLLGAAPSLKPKRGGKSDVSAAAEVKRLTIVLAFARFREKGVSKGIAYQQTARRYGVSTKTVMNLVRDHISAV